MPAIIYRAAHTMQFSRKVTTRHRGSYCNLCEAFYRNPLQYAPRSPSRVFAYSLRALNALSQSELIVRTAFFNNSDDLWNAVLRSSSLRRPVDFCLLPFLSFFLSRPRILTGANNEDRRPAREDPLARSEFHGYYAIRATLSLTLLSRKETFNHDCENHVSPNQTREA